MGLVARLRSGGHILYLTLLILATSGGAYWLGFHNAATVTQLCMATNDLRHRQILLWQYVIASIPAPAHELPVAKHERLLADHELIIYVEHVFAAQVCRPRSGP